MKKAIVLLSGGLDSATTLLYAKSEGYKCLCLIFDYGQRHKRELTSARKIAKKAGCEWRTIRFKLPWKGSSLLDKSMKVREFSQLHELNVLYELKKLKKAPSTYVPGRNIIFLSFAVSFAEAMSADAIFIGANAIDYSGYPDCGPEFLEAYRKAVKKGTRGSAKIKIKAPLIRKSKKEIVKLAKRLRVPLRLTWSCYKGGKRPCGRCDSCRLRAKGFREAGVGDPILG